MLCRNAAGCSNVQPIHAAVINEDGFVKIANPGSAAWGYRTEIVDNATPDRISGFSVQSIINLASDGRDYEPFLAKIDIEGFEENLFSSNTEWINRFPVIIIELHDWLFPKQAKSNPFLRTISELNRDFVSIGESVVSIANEL
jgi:FkbM family methyltransferase